MKKQNILNTTFTIIGTIIGAGFASGKEIFLFFNIYGIAGIIGILISITIISLVIYKILNFINEKSIDTYSGFIEKTVKNRYLRGVINICTNIFLLISFYIMVSGFSTYFTQEFNLNYIYGAIVIAIFSYIIFENSIDGIIKANKYLIPMLILFIILLGIKIFTNNQLLFLNQYSSRLIEMPIKAILYASYNSIVLIPILINFKSKILSKKQVGKISKLVWIIMIILSLLIFFVLLINHNEIENIDIPVVHIASKYGNYYKFGYGTVIIFAIFTSAIAAGYGFISNITQNRKKQKIINLLICITAVFISRIGFSNLVNYMYPVFGIVNIYQIFLILLL